MVKSKQVFQILEKFYRNVDLWKEVKEEMRGFKGFREKDFASPFSNLVITILSQNTNAKNTARAYLNLLKKVGSITPENILKLSERELSEAIKVGGLYRIKARRIMLLAQKIVEEYGGSVNELIVKGDPRRTRERLLALPGVGAKTADVFLAYCMKCGEIPIDRHITRITKRIGIVSRKANYDEIKRELKKGIKRKDRVRFHELLIRFGKDICRARNPLCENCPLNAHCSWERAQAGIRTRDCGSTGRHVTWLRHLGH